MQDFKKILIADSSPLYRNGVKIILAAGQEKFALYEADSSSSVLTQVEQHLDLDLIILDAALLKPDLSCPLKELISSNPITVLLLCSQVTSQTLRNACSLGVNNIALKRDTLSNLNHNILKVLGGEHCWPEAGEQVRRSIRIDTILKRMNDLTGRQKIVLDYLCHGMMNSQIGHRLGIRENTVKSHVLSIFRTLQVNNRTQLVVALQSHTATRGNRGSSRSGIFHFKV